MREAPRTSHLQHAVPRFAVGHHFLNKVKVWQTLLALTVAKHPLTFIILLRLSQAFVAVQRLV